MYKWKVWIETGSTFTDCLALDRNGDEYRARVFNNGCIRGKILEKLGAATYRIEQSWGSSRNIFNEYEFHLLSGESFITKVKGCDSINQLLTLSCQAPFNIVNREFELTSREEASILAIRLATQTSLSEEFPLIDVRSGSTLGTVALFERKCYKTLLLATTGFADRPVVDNSHAEHSIYRVPVYFNFVIEVDEGIGASGEIILNLPENYINSILRQVFMLKPEVIVITFQNSSANPLHEKIMANLLRAAGYKYVYTSHELPQTIKLLPATDPLG